MADRHPLKIIRPAAEMTAEVRRMRQLQRKVGLIPTMGALHEGHLELVKQLAAQVDCIVVSIFVNPTQFGPGEDYQAYPRTMEADIKLLHEQGIAEIVFAPSERDMYPLGHNRTWVTVDDLGRHLCGQTRPEHFRGVTTVVSRLFAITEPDLAAFGLKDAQQFFILKRMMTEMGFPARLVGVPTVRESDGLALSSRNRYLSTEERSQATALFTAVSEARALIEAGERRAGAIEAAMASAISPLSGACLDYAQVVETETLQPVDVLESGQQVLAAIAVWFGKARLIDNAIVDVS